MKTEKLKLCPFCGHKATLMFWHGRGLPEYKQKCGCDNGKCAMFHIWIPVEQWNKRGLNKNG
jgi:hypothetical protein